MTTNTPSLVLFDLDGVLAAYDRGARVARLADQLDVSLDAVWSGLFHSGLEDRFDAGEVDADTYLAELGRSLDRNVDRTQWADARRTAMHVDAGLPKLVANVRRRADVAVLTNNGGLLVDLLPRIAPSIASAFGEHVLCSARLGARKPDAAVYLEAVRSLGHAPSSTLFLDDAIANVEGARRAGLQAAHVATPADLSRVLATYGFG
ncbi:HAD family phosphatase [Lysobacter sp. TY2-98]|uniref:HAD family hydrolase n=1 Tax=Lysobacter sp. TY2-98 TaxID=2290922 RepID=UPI000E1FB996|nr:HAD family phosphatase [Lysobacter sp. TY2-98]AXK72623.1 HAD family phosphatase [Lysobacter sp. TY2-98]